jgi:molybdopterin-guanine dinucleotide biosynthesis protein A
MGREKSKLRLGPRTLLGHIKASAQSSGLKLRIIRSDAVGRCGPIGGIYTGLATSKTDAEIFLACDMPFVSERLIAELVTSWRQHRKAVFTTRGDERAANHRPEGGFPLIVPSAALPAIRALISKKQFSLQQLAAALDARFLKPQPNRRHELLNVNTPADFEEAVRQWEKARTQGEVRKTVCKE